MLLINKSFLQVILLFILTTLKKDKTFHVVYEKYPNFIFIKFISIINFFSFNNFKISSINKFRNNFTGIKDQDSINEANKYLDNIFQNSLRTGGQIFIENVLRIILWRSAAADKIFEYYFFLEPFNEEEYQYFQFIFKSLCKLRVFEKNILIKFTILKSTAKYYLFFIKNICIEKIRNIFKGPEISTLFNFSSLIIHPFSKGGNSEKDIINDAIRLFAKDYKVKKIFDYKSFINLSIINISLNINITKFFKLVYYLIILIIKFITSINFITETKDLIDKFIYLCLKDQKTNRYLKIFTFDPVHNNLIPILYFLRDKGVNICFTSFSIGHYYTRGFSDYNGPYNYLLSSNVEFEEIAKRSLFRGQIKISKCYLLLANLKNKSTNNSINDKDNYLKLTVVEGISSWYREISEFDSMLFASILFQIDSDFQNINITIKKKKKSSFIESYLESEYPMNKIQFSPAIRGFMGDLKKADFILSHGISSLAIKSSEFFNKPYIIFDKSDNSKNTWKILFGKSKVNPIFVNSKNSILNILMAGK